MISLGILLIILFLLLKSTKVPKQVYQSKVVYADHKEKPALAFYSSKYNLTGRPDYILHTKDGIIPLEIKNTLKPKQPYYSHIMQLMSYCLLIEEVRGVTPKYGFIQYRNEKPFSVPYTIEMKDHLLAIISEMRRYLETDTCPRPIRQHQGCRVDEIKV